MFRDLPWRSKRPLRAPLSVVASLVLVAMPFFPALQARSQAAGIDPLLTVAGSVSPLVASSRDAGALDGSTALDVAISLPWQNQAALNSLLTNLYNPASPLFHKFLSSADFDSQFGLSADKRAAIATYLQNHGLQVTDNLSNLMVVHGTAAQVQAALHVNLHTYVSSQGRSFYATATDPQIPASLAGTVAGIVGLSNAAQWHPQLVLPDSQAVPAQIGTGPGKGLAPADIRKAYNLTTIVTNTAGMSQTLAVFELAQYRASDITAYTGKFGLRAVPLQNVNVDGGPTTLSGAGEVELDIELQNALAAGASQIIVYNAPNSDAGVVDEYARIAADNRAKQISSSWGQCEQLSLSSTIQSENLSFQKMAAQGQSIFAAAGDSGAYDCGTSQLSVDDPASQPYVTGVGGTKLSVQSPGVNESYAGETVWNEGSGSAGGGGISTIWTHPSWQTGPGVSNSFSNGMREVPDVSLNADPYTGYAVYCSVISDCLSTSWTIFGGTSCAAPLWAAFTAIVNEYRVMHGKSTLGFANPAIYALAASSAYANDFHDVTTGNNLYYPATTNYDQGTGWGSFNGVNLGMGLINH